MQTERAQDLLEAVGVEWREDSKLHTWDNNLTSTCLYTGPALDTPELDALLLVAGQRWLRDAAHRSKRDVAKNLRYDSFEENSGGWVSGRLGLMFQAPFPGHALARAIVEVRHA